MSIVIPVAKRPERKAIRTNTNGFDAATLRLDTPYEHLLHSTERPRRRAMCVVNVAISV